MVKVNDEIAVVRSHGIIKCEASNAPPPLELPSLKGRESERMAIISDFYVKLQLAFRIRISCIEYVPHDLVAEVDLASAKPGLFS